jgi:hypothetical protein
MQPERDAVPGRELAHALGALVIEGGDRIRGGVELDVDVTDAVFRRPLDAVLELDAPAQIRPDALAQVQCVLAPEFVRSESQRARGRGRLETLTHQYSRYGCRTSAWQWRGRERKPPLFACAKAEAKVNPA